MAVADPKAKCTLVIIQALRREDGAAGEWRGEGVLRKRGR